jgi:hypothetical protein
MPATTRSARCEPAASKTPRPNAIIRTLYTKPSGVQSDRVGVVLPPNSDPLGTQVFW